MRIPLLLLSASAILIGCSGATPKEPFPNRWSDVRLSPVLEAQEHRDTKALCSLLEDPEVVVREAAALAFASVQDSVSIPCLLKALGDDVAVVRATAAFSLGFIANRNALEEMARRALEEKDSTVQRALFTASFLATQRSGQLKDPKEIINYLVHSSGHERIRAADALRRLPDSSLQRISADYLALFDSINPSETEAILTLALSKIGGTDAVSLARQYAQEEMPNALRVNALRALTTFIEPQDGDLFVSAAREGAVGTVAIEGLHLLPSLDHDQAMAVRKAAVDPLLATQALSLALWAGEKDSDSLTALLHHTAMSDPSPYVRAAAILANPSQFGVITLTEALDLLVDPSIHPAVRQAAFTSASKDQAAEHMRQFQQMIRPDEDRRWRDLRSPLHEAFHSGDAGLICASLEQLLETGGDPDSLFITPELERTLRDTLRPLADLEALRLLDKIIAMRTGSQTSTPAPVRFNHPVDPVKLRALKQGQRYRIVTVKGEIIIATDVDDCPGSSVVFDSLVVASYYNGKSFHRMVPGFVVQGGCPRGDGYGGMPWTLRTEIGSKLFTAGSVGLASAGRDTESCQFFITHSATPHLDGRYTRFGEVVSGMDVVWRLQVGDAMERVERIE